MISKLSYYQGCCVKEVGLLNLDKIFRSNLEVKVREGAALPSIGTVPRKILGIDSQDPSDSKSSPLYEEICQFCFIHVRYIL